MANPRQRSKARSGATKNRPSKRSLAKIKKNKTKTVFKGPGVLEPLWDRKKTTRQNYIGMGLLTTLNPKQSGGLERIEGIPFALRARQANAQANAHASTSTTTSSDDEAELDMDASAAPASRKGKEKESDKIPKGFARVERDADGNITKVTLADEDAESADEPGSTPWGAPLDVWQTDVAAPAEPSPAELEPDGVLDHTRDQSQGLPLSLSAARASLRSQDPKLLPTAQNRDATQAQARKAVAALEDLAAGATSVDRHTSSNEQDWLAELVKRYGSDIAAMARDKKLNTWQRTPGEIKRRLRKAGLLA